MLRFAVPAVLGMLGGCDVVLGIDSFDPNPVLCGPFGSPTPVAFAPALGDATDLSVAADGTHGTVHANLAGYVGSTPVVFDGQMWSPDPRPNIQMTLATQLSGAHMGVSGDVYGWIERGKSPSNLASLVHYTFASTWTLDTTKSFQPSSTADLIPGNEVESDAGSGFKTDYLVVIEQPASGGTNKIRILVGGPPTYAFAPASFIDPLNVVDGLSPTGGALTGDHGILVYSASLGGGGSHLYETAFTRDQFQPGHAITSLYVGASNDDQPWVNADCSQIWFRRDRVTYTAKKM